MRVRVALGRQRGSTEIVASYRGAVATALLVVE